MAIVIPGIAIGEQGDQKEDGGSACALFSSIGRCILGLVKNGGRKGSPFPTVGHTTGKIKKYSAVILLTE